MCLFLSAIVTKDGAILHHPMTDSHSLLAAHFGLHERSDGGGNIQKFVRVEYAPKDMKFADPDAYSLKVDETERPSWFDDDMREKTAAFLAGVISRMIVRDKRKVLLGGTWILAEGADIGEAHACRIVSMYGSAKVGSMYGSAKVPDDSRVTNDHRIQSKKKVTA